jgi:hypothetical protein
MRADRSRELAVGAFGIIEKNRPYQFDHYQINQEWQKLSIVLNGREIDSVHLSDPADAANPFDEPKELIDMMCNFLAPLELTLAFEYLYAYFSLEANRADGQLRSAVELSREYLLLIAINEMQHLRWNNEVLWQLAKEGMFPSYKYHPIINLAELVPEGPPGQLGPAPEMNWDYVQQNWEKFKDKVPQKWGQLARDSITGARGEISSLLQQEPNGYSKELADKEVDEWLRDLAVNVYISPRRKAEFFRPIELDAPTLEALKQHERVKLKLKELEESAMRKHPRDKATVINQVIDTELNELLHTPQLKRPSDCDWGWRKRSLRPLNQDAQDAFMRLEKPQAFIDYYYARVLATLDRHGETGHLASLIRRILHDGMQHEARFNAIRAALKPFPNSDYLRSIQPGSGATVQGAIVLRDEIVKLLRQAYQEAAGDDIGKSNEHIAEARVKMKNLLTMGETLAARKPSVGIPFFSAFPGS